VGFKIPFPQKKKRNFLEIQTALRRVEQKLEANTEEIDPGSVQLPELLNAILLRRRAP
jgi:hypothetical protein